MTWRLRVLPGASQDVTEGYLWYEERRSGLGAEFLGQLDATLSRVEGNPALYPVVYKTIRRALTQRFPYGVFYIVKGKTIHVLAVMHQARDPQRWQALLGE